MANKVVHINIHEVSTLLPICPVYTLAKTSTMSAFNFVAGNNLNIYESRCNSYGLSLASVPFHTPDRQHGTLCRTAFATLNQTLQSFGDILKLTCSVQHLMFVNFYSLILLSVDSVMHLCPFCNRRIINVR